MAKPAIFFATCARGLEFVLAEELRALGAESVEEQRSGVAFTGTLALGYRACLWLRTASRVFLQLASFGVSNEEDLYQGVRKVPWTEHLGPDETIAVDCVTAHPQLTHSHYAALKTKDAIVDEMRDRLGRRPSVNAENPDLRINLHLSQDSAIVNLDLSGESLHRRGYRELAGAAPLKESLAAAILLLADWPTKARAGAALLDPMCGSGTFLIEAAWMVARRAPGLGRKRFGFERWHGHDAPLWRQIRDEAAAQENRERKTWPRLVGYDVDEKAVQHARRNVAYAGLEDVITIEQRPLSLCQPPSAVGTAEPRGLLVVNPPYGERLGDPAELAPLYQELGDVLRRRFNGWDAYVLAGNLELAKHLGLRPRRRHVLFNGAIECRLLEIPVSEVPAQHEQGPAWRREPRPRPRDQVDPASEMFANRLRKNLKHLDKWARREKVTCFRVYDADLPEFAVAVDRYQDMAHVQEYACPETVDALRAAARLRDILTLVPEVLEIDADQVVLKVRRRQRGARQYEKQAASGDFHEVSEGGLKFLVNLRDYLDTGLFLDQRSLRAHIRELAKGRSFLNLFAYTATATVYAAAGGAKSTTSVDLSSTYLDWAQRNFQLNHLSSANHKLVRADCLSWLPAEKHLGNRYDLIFLAPPTFSNSKAMYRTLDIKRDYVSLIEQAAALLAPRGILLFASPLKNFSLNQEALNGLTVKETTRRMLAPDFARSVNRHGTWEIGFAE